LSIIHDALKRAESENKPRGESPGQSGKLSERGRPTRQMWQLLLSIGALCLGLAALVAAISLLLYPSGERSSAEARQELSARIPIQSSLPTSAETRPQSPLSPIAAGEQAQEVAAPSKPSVAPDKGQRPESEISSATHPGNAKAPTEAQKPDRAPASKKPPAKSLFITMSQGKQPVLKRESPKSTKKGKIDIRSAGRVKTALDLERERRALSLSHLKKAQSFADKGNVQLARQHFEKAIESEPDNVLALMGLGSFLLSQGKPVMAERFLRRGATLDKGSKEIKSALYEYLGQALAGQGQYEEAVNAYQTAIALNDGNLSAYNNMAVAYKRLGKRELAKRTYSRLLIVENRAPLGYYGLGLMNDDDGKTDEAIFGYSRFLVLAGSRYEELQEQVRKRVTFLRAKKEREKKRKFVHKEIYVP